MTAMSAEQRLIETLAYNLYGATLVGNPAPFVEELGGRIRHFVPGDLVLECSTIHMRERDGTRLGRLIRTAFEPLWTPEEWAAKGEDDPDEIPVVQMWYLQLADGREYRWHNARFIAVPTDIIAYRMPFVSNPDEILPAHTPKSAVENLAAPADSGAPNG